MAPGGKKEIRFFGCPLGGFTDVVPSGLSLGICGRVRVEPAAHRAGISVKFRFDTVNRWRADAETQAGVTNWPASKVLCPSVLLQVLAKAPFVR